MTPSLALIILAVVALFGLVTTLGLVPILIRKAHDYQLICTPGGHSNHQHPTPLLGGLAVYIPFAVTFAVFYLLAQAEVMSLAGITGRQAVSLFLATSWIMVLGTIDDKVSLGWKKKVLGEVLGVVILVLGGHTIHNATIPLIGHVEFGWLGIPLLGLAVLAITNAINLIDGVDGLAGGVCFFAAVVSAVIGFCKADYLTATLGMVVAGSLLGFLRYNFPPASIFLGDGGSLMLGFLLGTLATSSAALSPGQRSGTFVMVLAPFLPFGIALLDVGLAILRRSISGRNIFSPDKEHLHHFLMEKIGRPRAVVLMLYGFSLLLSAMTLTLVLAPASPFFTGFMVTAGLVILVVLTILVRRYTLDRLPVMLRERQNNHHPGPDAPPGQPDGRHTKR